MNGVYISLPDPTGETSVLAIDAPVEIGDMLPMGPHQWAKITRTIGTREEFDRLRRNNSGRRSRVLIQDDKKAFKMAEPIADIPRDKDLKYFYVYEKYTDLVGFMTGYQMIRPR